jgi:hypothetical protein
MKFDDGTFGVVDFKCTEATEFTAERYFNQLMGYSVALEHNDPEEQITNTCKISRLGLGCFDPNKFVGEKEKCGLRGTIEWVDIEKDMAKFKHFLNGVSKVLSGKCPKPNKECYHCRYRYGLSED